MIFYILSFLLMRVLRLVWGVIWAGLIGVGILWFIFYMHGESAAWLWVMNNLLELIWQLR